ncbi:hypothetical protein FA13DRAFT_1707060 [Coprinellus micaceus]|uniref:Uncharacterized protein n=1 Tax=Coprinellus micaceus TaxID=71717 RepID=A0A4Y7TMQ2_COPMI|nr:hypothetical protein FA13DRAFT_1707060 [Coprinellus micaceus]
MPPIRHITLPSTPLQTAQIDPYPDQISSYFSASMVATFLNPVVREGDGDPNLKYRRIIGRTNPMVLVTFDSTSNQLRIFAVPTLSGRRVDVERWHQLRRTHEFRFPDCMCGFEVSIFKVTNSLSRPWLNGKYVAACADANAGCKYFVHNLETLANAHLQSRDIVVNLFTPEPRASLTKGTATPSTGGSSRTDNCGLFMESPTIRMQGRATGCRRTHNAGTQAESDTVHLRTVMDTALVNLIPRRTPPSIRELQLSTPLSILLEMDRQDVDAGVHQREIKRAITKCDECGLQRTSNTYLLHICPPRPLTVAEKEARETRLHSPFLILLEMDKHDPDSGVYDDELFRAIKKCLNCGIFRTLTYFDAHVSACSRGLTSNTHPSSSSYAFMGDRANASIGEALHGVPGYKGKGLGMGIWILLPTPRSCLYLVWMKLEKVVSTALTCDSNIASPTGNGRFTSAPPGAEGSDSKVLSFVDGVGMSSHSGTSTLRALSSSQGTHLRHGYGHGHGYERTR